MKHSLLRSAIASCLLLCAAQASAIPVSVIFQGRLNQAIFDPGSPFGGAIAAGTRFTGRYSFDTAAPDAIADPTVGSYTSSGFAYNMSVNIGGINFVADNFVNVGVVNGATGDQYTVLAQNGGGGGLADALTMTLFLQGPSNVLSSDAQARYGLNRFLSRSFSLDAIETTGGVTYQYQFTGSIDALQVPEPGSLWLLAAGLAALAGTRLRRSAHVPRQG